MGYFNTDSSIEAERVPLKENRSIKRQSNVFLNNTSATHSKKSPSKKNTSNKRKSEYSK